MEADQRTRRESTKSPAWNPGFFEHPTAVADAHTLDEQVGVRISVPEPDNEKPIARHYVEQAVLFFRLPACALLVFVLYLFVKIWENCWLGTGEEA